MAQDVDQDISFDDMLRKKITEYSYKSWLIEEIYKAQKFIDDEKKMTLKNEEDEKKSKLKPQKASTVNTYKKKVNIRAPHNWWVWSPAGPRGWW